MIDKDKVKALGFEILDSLKAQNPLYDNLKSNFPQTIDADGKPNLKAIATLLGLSNKADMQGYELTFSGKGLANALYSTPCAKELKLECVCHSKALDEEFLSHQDSYAEAVEMRNCGFQTRGEGSLNSNLSKTNKQANQGRNILDEKSGLCSLEQGSRIEAFTDEAKGKLHDLSLKDKPSNTKNTIIRGDNLDVLKLLKSAYSEKIKMIYIDPPYNTKNDNFIYPDDFRKDYQEILKEVGLLQENEKGEWIESESLKFFKNITGSKSHSGWLSFMLPRLKLARDLLREDGVIFISIDDNEQANLKILCDEIFGEENFVACLCIVDNLKGNNNTDGISQTNEYCLIYAKSREILKIGELKIQEDDENLQKWNIDNLGYWKEGRNIKGTGENAPREKRPSMFYPIYLNDNMEISLEKNDEFYIEVLPLTNGKEMCWNWGKDFLRNNKHELIVKKTDNGFNFIKKQRPVLGDLPSKKIKTTCYSPKYSTSVSSNTIKEIFSNEKVFNYSKSIYLIKDFLQISTSPNNANNEAFIGGGGGNAS